ncbi:alpha/beta hydrolase [Stenotrophomonas sp. NPDC087984]
MDYATLKALQPSEFEDAAAGYRATRDLVSGAKDILEQRIAGRMQADLEGEAASAALKQLRELWQNFHYVQVECGLLTTALTALFSDMEAAKKKLEAAVEDARADKMTVNADGSVSYPAGGEKVDGKVPEGGRVTGSAGGDRGGSPLDPVDPSSLADALDRQAAAQHPNPYFGRAIEYANRIAEAVKEATEADELWAPKLRRLKADDDLTVSSKDWIDVEKDTGGVRKAAKSYLDGIKPPPQHGDPIANAAWWRGLSPEEQDAYISLHPARVGDLDGLPAEVRDEANRTVLAESRAQVTEERTRLLRQEPQQTKVLYDPETGQAVGKVNTVEWSKWNDRKKQLDNAISGMDIIQRRFEQTGTQDLPKAYLLGFDPFANKDGRVIIANGNPDTADHTAVFVPGTKTVLGNIDDEIDKSDRLWRQSNKLAPGESTSTITWFDYDAPRSAKPGDAGDIDPEARHDSYASKAAPTLRHFMDGAEAAHRSATGDTAHTTLIGHSYGSTVIGDTTKYPSDYRVADDIIAVGSPGMQVDRAADLGLNPKHVWAMAGGGEDRWVREGGRLAGLGDNRVIPTDEAFGANLMASDSPSHGGFWNEENDRPSVSLENQAKVIVGRYDDVKLYREAHW